MRYLNYAVSYAYTNHYSKSMVRPTEWLLKARGIHTVTATQGITYHLRLCHGILHAVAVMELIPKIIELYRKLIPDFQATIKQFTDALNMTDDVLPELLQIIGLFHDSARQGDGTDYWDDASADICKQYLIAHCQLLEDAATLFSNTIKYKDDRE